MHRTGIPPWGCTQVSAGLVQATLQPVRIMDSSVFGVLKLLLLHLGLQSTGVHFCIWGEVGVNLIALSVEVTRPPPLMILPPYQNHDSQVYCWAQFTASSIYPDASVSESLFLPIFFAACSSLSAMTLQGN